MYVCMYLYMCVPAWKGLAFEGEAVADNPPLKKGLMEGVWLGGALCCPDKLKGAKGSLNNPPLANRD